MFNKKKDQTESSPVPDKKANKTYETPLLAAKSLGGL
jgi:hypothetical protein